MNSSDQELEFPCHYPIKVIGESNDIFRKNILQIIHGHFKKRVSDDLLSFKHSKNNKYLSITINFEAESRQHVDNIYKDLKACEQVVHLM